VPDTQQSGWADLEQLLAQCDCDMGASEADGLLASLASMLGVDAVPVWMQQVLGSDQREVTLSRDALSRFNDFAQERLGQLEAGDMSIRVCLPGDDDDLRDRTEALASWAAGFLHGLAHGASLRGAPARQRLEEAPLDELIRDLTEISRAQAELGDEPQEALEGAFFELAEFLRVVAQLAFDELVDVRGSAEPAPALH
jgi:uncharacterized protein YgfB (UPF0149 family)